MLNGRSNCGLEEVTSEVRKFGKVVLIDVFTTVVIKGIPSLSSWVVSKCGTELSTNVVAVW